MFAAPLPSRRFAVSVALLACFGVPCRAQDPAPNSAAEARADRLALVKSAAFLDTVALNWTEKRKCGTCHTNYVYLFARPSLKEVPGRAMDKVRGFFEDRAANWDKGDKFKPRWDTEVVATAVTLAFHDAQTTGKLHPLTRQALDRMWTLQKDHGAWSWLKCNWPPFEHDDYFGAVFAAIGVGAAPDNYAQSNTAQSGLTKLRGYLKKNPPPDLHHQTMLLWASCKLDGLMSPNQRQETIKKLLALQWPDGGWSLPSLGGWKRHDGTPNDKDAPSDGYATGLAVYVLRQTGLPASNPQLRRAVSWLSDNQRVSGRWFTRSLSNDGPHYITHAGTAFAVMALRACGVPEPLGPAQ
jgi:squalene-hopene/tetraprenyl-beta-curcumene cyclase